MQRRTFLAASATILAGALTPYPAWAVPKPYSWDSAPPTTGADAFVQWMVVNRGEDPRFLRARFARYQALLANGDLLDDRNARAYLMTPREAFVGEANLARAYEPAFLDIGYGVTICGPQVVGRMTTALDVKFGDRVLEVGTGSGYQSAYLANLTDAVWTIEIIAPLAERTRTVREALIARGYTEYRAIRSKPVDGYYGWEEAAPFDKIIVTCGIDHIPPPLLRQLKTGGSMVVPVGPPGAQRLLKIVKQQDSDGAIKVTRSDVYEGRAAPLVPFTRLDGATLKGTPGQL